MLASTGTSPLSGCPFYLGVCWSSPVHREPQYFLVLTLSFLVLIIMGGIATFNNGTIDNKFSSWWDKYPDAAEKVGQRVQA